MSLVYVVTGPVNKRGGAPLGRWLVSFRYLDVFRHGGIAVVNSTGLLAMGFRVIRSETSHSAVRRAYSHRPRVPSIDAGGLTVNFRTRGHVKQIGVQELAGNGDNVGSRTGWGPFCRGVRRLGADVVRRLS